MVLLRYWRERRGLSLRELAVRAGVSYVTVVRVEHNQMSPTVRWLEKVAEALDVDVRELLERTKQRNRGK